MHHYFEAITTTSGDSLIGYFARVVDPATNNGVTIAADNNGTPISTVSGVDNAAKTDAYGNLDFYVQPGTYHLDIYAPNATSLQLRVQNVAMNSTKGDTGAQGLPGNDGQNGAVGASDASFTTLAAMKAIDPVAYPSPRLAAPSGSNGGVTNGLFNYQTGNFTGRTDVVQVNGIPLTTGALVRQNASQIAATLPAGVVYATANDALAGVVTAYLDSYNVKTVGLQVAADAAIAAGARRLIAPNGIIPVPTVWTPPNGMDGLILEGSGATVFTCSQPGGAGGFRLAPIGGSISNITYRNFNINATTGGVGALHWYFAQGSNILVENVVSRMASGLDMNGVLIALAGGGDGIAGGVLSNMTLRNIFAVNSNRMAFEFLNQGMTGTRPIFKNLVGENLVADTPGSVSYGYGFSFDGANMNGAKMNGLVCRGGYGAAIELIECSNIELTNTVWDAWTGRPIQATNSIVKDNCRFIGGRNINGNLMQDALFGASTNLVWQNMDMTFATGAISVLSNAVGMKIKGGSTRATSTGVFAPIVVNGPNTEISGHTINATAAATAYCVLFTGASATRGSVSGCRLINSSATMPLIADTGATFLGSANILDGTNFAVGAGS